MDPAQGFQTNSFNPPSNAGGHHLPYIPSLEQNVYKTRNRTATTKHSLKPELKNDASFLLVKRASRVVQILTDGISEVGALESKESLQDASPASNCEQNILPVTEQNIKDCISISSTLTSRRAKKIKHSNNETTNAISSKPLYPMNDVHGSSISSESMNWHETYDRGNNDVSHAVLTSSHNDPELLQLGTSAKTERILGNESRDILLSSQIADSAKNESPLEKKKRMSKIGIKNKKEELSNGKYSTTNLESNEGYPFLVPSTYTTQASRKTSKLMKGGASLHIPRCVLIKPTEVPSEAQLEKLLSMQTGRYDLQCPPKWFEGDLLWAKVHGHPFWPCMVSRCPFSKMYTKIKGDVHIVRSYHVQFFGNEAERGWTTERSTIIFEGKLKFLEMAQFNPPKSKKGKSSVNPFKVNMSRRHAWNIAVEEAEGAIPLSREERNVQYTFDYIFRNDVKREQQRLKQELLESSKMKVKDSLSYKPITDSTPKRASSESNISPAMDTNKKRKLDLDSLGIEASFSEYYAKHRRSAIEQHPGMGTAFVFDFLCQQWEAQKKKTAKQGTRSSYSQTADSSSVFQCTSILPDQSNGGEGHTSNLQLAKMLSQGSQTEGLLQQTGEKTNVSQKRIRRPRIIAPLQEYKVQSAHSSGAVVESVHDVPDLERDIAKPALVTSTLDAHKRSQTNVSQKRIRRPRIIAPLQENKVQATPSSGAVVESVDDVPDLERDIAKPALVTSALIAHETSQTKVSQKRIRRPRIVASPPENEVQATPSSGAVVESVDDVPDLERDITKPALATSALIAHETSQTNVSQKRIRRPRIVASPQENELQTAPSSGAVVESVDDVPDLERDIAKPALATSALIAHKTSQGRGKDLKITEPYELEIFKLNSTCKIEKDKICAVCEKNGDHIECTGPCGQHFHASCVGLKSHPVVENYVCTECTSGTHTCFACKKADMETVKCSVNLCGKYYHEDCIRKFRLSRLEGKGFICPLHTCATCAVDSAKNPKALKGRFYRCVRCPTAYHVGDLCIAAGSVNLAGSHIVCSDHFQPNRSMSCHSRLNITWCFSCSRGGTLLCCESCPAAFHPECVKVDKTPEDAWFCMGCAEGRKPLYGNIVWIKVGNYRWWPGEICHPRHVPLNIQEKVHHVGEFPVRFFGSHDYYWIHKGRVFLFQEGDKGSKEGSSRGLFKAYTKGVQEATEAYKLWAAAEAKKVEQEQERTQKKPAPYKYIKSNVPVGKVQIHKAELSEIPLCECRADQEDACAVYCLNRLMMYECHPNTCPAGEKCHNQRFQKRQYVECEPFKSDARGWGLRSLEDIKKGQFVLEYVGDVVDEIECKRRIEQAHEDNITNFYMLTMDKNRIIDAGPRGNFSRFLNHSCCPNMETQKWTVNGDIRVGLFALYDIPKGMELTFNYNLECLGNEKRACACGSENCSGFLGVRPKNAATNDKKIKEPKKKRRKKKLDIRIEYEDECFRCGEGGELVMCDKGNCPKVYHLKCLKLTKLPSGKWLCPWHHCDECGKTATVKCLDCPNSYCLSHTNENIFKVDDTYLCSDHTDILGSLPHLPVNISICGVKGVKSEVKSSTNDNNAASIIEGHIDASKVERSSIVTNSEAAAVADTKQNVTELIQVSQALVNTDHKLKLRQKGYKNVRTEVKGNPQQMIPIPPGNSAGKSVLERNLGVPGIIDRSAAGSKLNVNSVNVQSDTSSTGVRRMIGQPVRRIEATLCRTKARYKARLSPAGIACVDIRPTPVNKPATSQ